MESKKYTLEELEEKYKACIHQSEMIRKQIDEKKKDEEKKLAKVKDARKKEIDLAIESVRELISAWVKDYGTYSFEYKDENWGDEDFYRSYLYHLFF